MMNRVLTSLAVLAIAGSAASLLLGASAGRLALAAAVAAVLLASAAIARVPLPPAARAVLGLMAVYALSALGVGFRQSASLPFMLNGGSLWTVLPFWLQGAFIGLGVVVPLGLVAMVARATAALRAREVRHWSLQAVGLTLSVLMALPALTAPGTATPAADTIASAPEPAEEPALALPTPPQTTEPVASPPVTNEPVAPAAFAPASAAASAGRLATELPRLRFDLGARTAGFGPGVTDAFTFVRDFVGFDSYPGLLRGAEGTYRTRAGNAWDRALLLSTMLREHGIRTRYALAHATDAFAEDLYDRLFIMPPHAPGDGAPSQDSAAPSAFLTRLRARATRDFALVQTALDGTMPTAAAATRDEILEELADHVWVQAEVDGAWIDLDPSLPDARPGEAPVQPDRTVDEPPDDAWQRVRVRVVAEQLLSGVLVPRTVLDVVERAPDILGAQVFVTHVPDGGEGAVGSLARLAGQRWRPILWMDGTIRQGQAVTFGPGSEAGSFFFGGSDTTFVAEWLEIELAAPGGRRETSRRALVDRAAGTPRRTGTITPDNLAPLEVLNQGPVAALAFHNVWFTGGAHDLPAYAEAVSRLAAALDPAAMQEADTAEPTADDQLWLLALKNFPFIAWSEHVILPAVNETSGVRLYADRPRVLIFSVAPSPEGPGGLVGQYDLHRDRLRAIVRDESLVAAAAERKLWFGLLEGALEHELTAAEVGDVGGDASDFLTTSSLVSARGVVTIRPGSTDAARSAAGGENRAARMESALARGSTLVVPAPVPGEPARGWWEISGDGDTKAIIDGDLGGSTYAHGKGPGYGRVGGGTGPAGGRVPRIPRAPGPTGPSKEYIMLLQLIAFAVIYVLEAYFFAVHMAAVERGITVLQELDRRWGGEE